jgi:hypothetical protein
MNLLHLMKKAYGCRGTKPLVSKEGLSSTRCNNMLRSSNGIKKKTFQNEGRDPPALDKYHHKDDNGEDKELSKLEDFRDIPDVVTIETGSEEDDVSELHYPCEVSVILDSDRPYSMKPRLVHCNFRPKQVSKIERSEKLTRLLGDEWPSDEEGDIIIV